jgi:hypothetical protein
MTEFEQLQELAKTDPIAKTMLDILTSTEFKEELQEVLRDAAQKEKED